MQEQVLALLSQSHEPLSAYDILGELRASNPKLAPPTIYRALTALTDKGDVHRLESRNAFVACRGDHHESAMVLSICDDCGSVEESASSNVLKTLSDVAAKSGFVPDRHVVEILGRCGDCAAEDQNA